MNVNLCGNDQLDDAYEYFLPNRNLFEDSRPGQKKMERIFDSTALEAIQQGASKLQENIAPYMVALGYARTIYQGLNAC